MREPSASAAHAAEILDRLGARWALIGALAALRYRATPRITIDADLLVEPVPGLADAFRSEGYDVEELSDEEGEPPHMLVVRGNGDRIDILIPLVEYQQVTLDRAVDNVITVEDVIVHKLIAWRTRDRDDIVSILRAGHPFDEEYIAGWAREWDVADRWEQAKAAG